MEDKENWPMGDLVEVDAEEWVGVKRRFRDSLVSCRVRRRKVLECVVEAVKVAVVMVDDTVVASPGTAGVADPCIDELSAQWSSTRA